MPPDYGGQASFGKLGQSNERIAEIAFNHQDKEKVRLSNDLILPPVLTVVEEVVHVALRATDQRLAGVISDMGITVYDSHGNETEYPGDGLISANPYSGYFGKALKNHCSATASYFRSKKR